MTPKEKAKELVEQFNCGGLETFAGHNVKVISKQCALIAVNEIIDILWHTHKNEIEYRYWQEVEQEILAL
jgi:hypothetical protein